MPPDSVVVVAAVVVFVVVVVVVVVVVLTLTHRHNAVRGHRTGSNVRHDGLHFINVDHASLIRQIPGTNKHSFSERAKPRGTKQKKELIPLAPGVHEVY